MKLFNRELVIITLVNGIVLVISSLFTLIIASAFSIQFDSIKALKFMTNSTIPVLSLLYFAQVSSKKETLYFPSIIIGFILGYIAASFDDRYKAEGQKIFFIFITIAFILLFMLRHLIKKLVSIILQFIDSLPKNSSTPLILFFILIITICAYLRVIDMTKAAKGLAIIAYLFLWLAVIKELRWLIKKN